MNVTVSDTAFLQESHTATIRAAQPGVAADRFAREIVRFLT